MVIERTEYWAKPGQEAAVLETRRHASKVRLELGLPSGSIRTRVAGDGPDVSWQCSFANDELHAADQAARDSSGEFEAVRMKMRGLYARFERILERPVEG